ncbi:unnamed protein product [Ceutorhynchus assimilis]|uniref:Kinesin-like protein n=1 Tax=Ceutorhynchus assimilis TaxID=467358 RepID=A0A9N9MEL7_9CUCU|nr:unnamed protein product [Ceutorhynchus assimilis]
MAGQSNNQKKKLGGCQNIKVVVRVRPFDEKESRGRSRMAVNCISPREIQTKDKKYYYDRVFQPDCNQLDIYSYVVEPMINDVLAGYNCTVFAYGQTGTGKTHTMTGGDPSSLSSLDWRRDEKAGCIPRAAANIFDEIASMKVNDYNVRVSFLELYNEEVRDLLNPDERQPPLNIFNDNKGAVFIQNLNEKNVFNSNDIYALLQQGTLRRQTASTLMNNHSSRSHTVFTITVHIKEADLSGEEVLKTGKINLVDLAGSENIAKSGAKDKRALELANINRSLLTLGRVIQTLTDKNNRHVPYRDSKLTRILQDSLGGHTKTCIIATVSPAYSSYEETQSTLEYAMRARDIKNTPMVNEKVTRVQMFKEMTTEIEKLKRDLEAARLGEGFFLPQERWDEIQNQLHVNSNSLTMKNEIIDGMKKRLADLEVIQEIKSRDYEEAMKNCKNKEKIIHKATALLKEHRESLQQEKYVSKHYFQAVQEENTQAKCLLQATDTLTKSHDVLQRKLEDQYFNSYSNERLMQEKCRSLQETIVSGREQLDKMSLTSQSAVTNQMAVLEESARACHQEVERCAAWKNEIEYVANNMNGVSEVIERTGWSGMDNVKGTQSCVNEVMGLVDKGCKNFEKYTRHAKQMNKVRSRFRDMLHKQIQHKRQQIKLLEQEVEEMVETLDTIDRETNTFIIEEEEEKNIIKQDFTSITTVLENTRVDLVAQTESLEENFENITRNNNKVKSRLTELINEKIDTETAHLNLNQTQIDTMKQMIASTEKSLEIHISEQKSLLETTEEIGKDLLEGWTPVIRAGDTPNKISLNYPKRVGDGALPRDVLIKKFKEEFDEDIENESFHLNVSTNTEEHLSPQKSNEYSDTAT